MPRFAQIQPSGDASTASVWQDTENEISGAQFGGAGTWIPKDFKRRRLAPLPGKHTVRLAIFAQPVRAGGATVVRTVSGRVDIEIGTATAAISTTTAQNLSFGPVIERVIQDNGRDSWALNLASGKVVTSTRKQPLDFRVDAADTLRAAKVDLYRPIYANTADSIMTLDMTVVSLGPSPDGWNISASGAVAQLDNSSVGVRRSELFIRGSRVYVFSTREGATGVMQIVGMDKPQGVKLRYKLVQKGQPSAELNPQPKSLPERLLATGEFTRIELFIKNANAPVTIQYPAELSELTPGSASTYRLRSDVVSLPILPAEKSDLDFIPLGEVFYLPAGKTFYIQWDGVGASTLHYYGPFHGDPVATLGLQRMVPSQPVKLLKAELQQAKAEAADRTLAAQPPVVVETFPVSGARDVAPGETEIRVRFSKPMTDGSWSWSTAWENSAPGLIGRPHYEADGRTCVVKAKLEAGRSYAFWLNSEKFQNFTDAYGRPAVPYLLIFQTKPK